MQNSMLSSEVIGIVQHVELNRSGWWERAVQRLVLAAIWLATEPLDDKEILKTLQADFSLALSNTKLSSALTALVNQGLLVTLSGPKYRIPDKERASFSKEIADAEAVLSDARNVFIELCEELCPDLDSSLTWSKFESDFLTPLIATTGANAYSLIAGQRLEVNKQLSSNFLSEFDSTLHAQIKVLVTSFLDPKIQQVRSYVSRMLHARFCVEAGGLQASIIKKLNSAAGTRAKFRIFVDTNFLFSLLELHENPSNEAAHELLDLVRHINANIGIKLYILPRTIEEAKTSISSAMHRLSRLPASSNFSAAAQKVGVSGMAQRFIAERTRRGGKLTAEDWFEPYLKNFVTIARDKGIELFNDGLNALATRVDVTDDILSILEYEKTRDESRRKSYDKVAHDVIMWHFICDNRPAYIESPIDVQDWILTVDFRFIGFDEHKQRQSGSTVPICLHPTSLIQLLQFWLPRNKEFEEAMLGSIRLPFLFQEFDVEAERTSIRILNGLARFEGREDIPAETIINVVLNDGLRSRLTADMQEEGADEVALIRDALLEEVRAKAAAEAAKVDNLTDVLTAKEATIGELDTQNRAKEDKVSQLNGQIAAVERQSQAVDVRLAEQDTVIGKLTSELEKATAARETALALIDYAGRFLVVMIAALGAAWNSGRFAGPLEEIFGELLTAVFVGLLVFVAGHLFLEWWARGNRRMTQLWPYKQITRFRGWLWSFVVLTFLVGVVGNLYANQVQKKIDAADAVRELHQNSGPAAPVQQSTK